MKESGKGLAGNTPNANETDPLGYDFQREFAETRELLADGRLNHGLVVPDANRRYALKMGLPSWMGHQAGAEKGFELLDLFLDLNIKYVTAWGLSKRNLSRSPYELRRIFQIMTRQIEKLEPYLDRKGGRFQHVGDPDGLPNYLLRQIDKTTQATHGNSEHVITFLINYGSMTEHLDFGRQAIALAQSENLAPEDLTEDMVVSIKKKRAEILPPAQFVFRSGEDEDGLVHLSDLGPLIEGAYICAVPETFPEVQPIQVLRGLKAYGKANIKDGK